MTDETSIAAAVASAVERFGRLDVIVNHAGFVVSAERPPLRLPLGTDPVAAIEAKNAFVAHELDEWRQVATSTYFA